MKNKTYILIAVGLVSLVSIFAYKSSQNKNVVIRPLQENTTQLEEATQSETVEQEGYVDVSPQEAKALIEETPDLVIIDVSPKYAEGHLPGAINYYLGDGSLDEAIPILDKTKPYLVYCHVDSVAIAGAKKLVEAGVSEVYRLEGNYAAWVAAGYEVETEQSNKE